MLKSCLPYLGSPDCLDNNKSRSRDESSFSLGYSFESKKNVFVRVVHAGGKIDYYPNAILASKLLDKLEGKWLARPQVFKHPHQSLIRPEEYLLPGHKYYVLPLSTIHKLKTKHNHYFTINQDTVDGGSEKAITTVESAAAESVELECSFCSAKDFYVSNEEWSRWSVKKRSRVVATNRILAPHPQQLPKPSPSTSCRGNAWEPSLSSIKELSP